MLWDYPWPQYLLPGVHIYQSGPRSVFAGISLLMGEIVFERWDRAHLCLKKK